MNGKPLLKEKDKKKTGKEKWSLSKWQKECDTLLQKRSNGMKCEICGKPAYCFHHFFPKSVSSRLRYDFDNLIPICQGCHSRHHQAGDPRIHGTVTKKRGLAWYDTLLKKKYEEIKVNKGYYKYIYEWLSQ